MNFMHKKSLNSGYQKAMNDSLLSKLHIIDIDTYGAVCASTNKETSIFTVTHQIPNFSFCNTMESSNGTIVTPKYANIGLKLLLPTSW